MARRDNAAKTRRGHIRRMPRDGYVHQPAITDPMERFARGLAAGLPQTEAARIAGYADPGVAAARLKDHPAVRAVVRAARTNRLDKLASLSIRVLEELLRKPKVSDAVRLNAVKLSLALAGHTETPQLDGNQLNKKDISAMSIDELDVFLAAERSKRANAAKPIIDQVSEQPSPNPLQSHDMSEPFAGSALLIEATPFEVADAAASAGAATRSPPGPADGDPPPGVPPAQSRDQFDPAVTKAPKI